MAITGKVIEIENHIANRGTFSPTNFSFGLLLASSTITRIGTNQVAATEPAGGYQRFPISPTDWIYTTNDGWGEYWLNRELHFGLATDAWPNIRYLALFCDELMPGEGTLLRAIPITGGIFTANIGEGVCFNNPLVFRIGKDVTGNPQSFRKKVADHVLGISPYNPSGLWIGIVDTNTSTEIGTRIPAPASLTPTYVTATSWITRWGGMTQDVYLPYIGSTTTIKWFLSSHETGLNDAIWFGTPVTISASCANGPFLPPALGPFYNILGGAFWGGI